MGNKAMPVTRDGAISRRTFLKASLGLGVVAVMVPAAGGLLAGCAKTVYGDITAASSTDFNHAHNVTIPGADIGATAASKTYTSDGPTHQHAITLVKADFEKLQKGQTVSVTSTATGSTPHTHTWALKTA
ncbi:MAG: hypothetical protein A2147_00245 [Chloroflexi bacterium RBG_16_57_8]|nr:MAG: hypothetical protein A2147_00245 [Chloroflexi bacterium RBG_16_57_8]